MSRSSSFDIIPVLHIASGQVIRWEGDHFVRCQGGDSNPLSVALHWIRQGATKLHLVDLDAVYNRVSAAPALVLALRNFSVRTSLAGGIHSLSTAKERLSYGASSLVVGSLLDRPNKLAKVVSSLGPRPIWGSIDLSERALVSSRLQNAANAGIRTLVLSARTPDILSTSHTFGLIHDLVHDGASIWASGQICDYQLLLALRQAGCQGALISRALHERTLTLDGIAQAFSSDHNQGPKTA